MVELLLFAILVMLVLIYLQQKKSVKEVDSYFAAIDLSLRQYFSITFNQAQESSSERHEEVIKELDKISSHSDRTASILNKAHNPKSIEQQYWESERS
jgi:uncharacterized membrane protein